MSSYREVLQRVTSVKENPFLQEIYRWCADIDGFCGRKVCLVEMETCQNFDEFLVSFVFQYGKKEILRFRIEAGSFLIHHNREPHWERLKGISDLREILEEELSSGGIPVEIFNILERRKMEQ